MASPQEKTNMVIGSSNGPSSRAALVTNGIPTSEIPGLFTCDNAGMEQLIARVPDFTKPSYTHGEIFGEYCHTTAYIRCPVDMAFDYASNVYCLEEFTFSLRDFHYVGGGIYKALEALGKDTYIYMRIDSYPDCRVVDHLCAWDQGEELWMRYHFRFLDAMPTIRRAGTIAIWSNCKHPYYDRNTKDVPAYIANGRERADRTWVGDIWPDFHAMHSIEIGNFKRILEHRFANA
jgi:hypothetical protein